MKKITVFLLITALLLSASGCISGKHTNDAGLRIVTTVFPIYDWVKEIANGDPDVEITLLSRNGSDMHSFQPKASDIIKITDCDVFIYIGGESDSWVEKVFKNNANKDLIALNLLDILGEKAHKEELTEGMEGEADEDDYDEHVWMSLTNASLFCEEIAAVLSEKKPDCKDLYNDNLERYKEKLSALDSEYRQAVESSEKKTIIVGDRFPFRYLTEDYGIGYFAAFSGCSAESEASFETVTFLAKKVEELDIGVILKLENSDGKICEAVKNACANKDIVTLTLNSIQSVTDREIEDGVCYLEIMEQNLEVLKTALK